MSDSSPRAPRCACPLCNPLMLLMILLAVTMTGWVVTALNRDRPAATAANEPPRAVEPVFVLVPLFGTPAPESIFSGELVAVPVAVKDLPVGTVIRKVELSQFVTWKMVPKDSLPPMFVADEADLTDMRLTRPVLKDETFAPGALSRASLITIPEGMNLVTLSVSAPGAAFVTPGSRVDILAAHRRGGKLEVFVLLEEVFVLAVSTRMPYGPAVEFPNATSLSVAVDQDQALLLTLAKQRGCVMEVLLRAPGKPLALTKEDYKKRAKFFQELIEEGKVPVAPAPRAK